MPDLLKAIGDFFAMFGTGVREAKVTTALSVLRGLNGKKNLDDYVAALDADVRNDPRVQAAYREATERTTAQGEMGMFGDMAKALYSGFGALAEPMEKAVAEMLEKSLQPGSPDSKHVIEGALDTLVDGFLNLFARGGKEIPAAVRSEIKSVLKPMLSLGLTFTVATCLAELIHPTKEMGWGRVSHFLYDTVGFKAMSEAYTFPLRRALIEYPTTVAINTAIQPYLPTEGELTGLARKHEITQEQYRTAMRTHGVKEEYIDSLLTGFWADPRLFEILRILDVSLPSEVCPPEARKWLDKAGLGQYTDRNWWLAYKFAKAGYDDIDIPELIKVARKRYIQTDLGNIKAVQRQKFKRGAISRSEYERALASRGISPEEAKDLLDAVEDERKSEYDDEKQKLFERKFLNGRMTEAELRAAFAQIPLGAEYIEWRVKLLVEQKLGKLHTAETEKTLTKTDITRAFSRGKLTKEAAAKKLDGMGWSLDDAIFLVENEDVDEATSVAAETIRAAEQKARNLRLSKSELLAVYVANGKSAAWAAARAAYIEELVLGKKKTE